MARLKIVAHLRTGKLMKGYVDLPVPTDNTGLVTNVPISLPKQITIENSETHHKHPVALSSLKALFFVKSFQGNPSYSEIKFFNGEPKIEGLWVQLTFADNEKTEGIVHNSIAFLTEPGFLMKPPDPNSNNQAVYVLKESLTQFRVVGVRANY
ncbi:MAG TPA: hypothetical protein VG897_18535 [Terriglobales bacterium]|nr:hypothetical protein [Terriglobales bacterium]